MKNFNIIALSVLALAVLGLYIMQFTSKKSCSDDSNTDASQVNLVDSTAILTDTLGVAALDSTCAYPIAYVNVGKLQESLQKFDFYKKWNEKLLQKEAKSTKEMKDAQQKLATELEVFQQKYQAGGFLTKESFEQEQNRLYSKNQELQELQMRLEQDFANEQLKLTKQLMDTIDNFFKIYNQDRKYIMIVNSADLLYADESMDITSDVLSQLNDRYSKKK